MDSALGNRSVADGAITNSYNTLTSCYVFIAQEQPQDDTSASHGILGIFKNGNIIWNSGPVINSSLSVGSLISATRDLNDDGKVEMITSWFEGAKGDIERLWIFTWDGSNGNLINAVDQINESILILTATGIKYVDIDGNNIFEITGLWYDNENDEEMKKIIYSWNGAQYGKWANSPQPLPSGFYPRDKVDVTLKAVVNKIDSMFSYHYDLRNLLSSKQKINEFILDTSPDSINNDRSPNYWVLGGVVQRALGWLALPGFNKFIDPGKGDTSFYFETCRLPSIVTSLVRGENGSWIEIFGDTLEYTLDQWYDEAKSNSSKVFTIGPASLTNPSVLIDFIDTLNSFTTRSRDLGWITTQPTADKYLAFFTSAKASLQSNNIGAVRVTLNSVLSAVNQDSSSTLTSEAYALIRYNTEYLLQQLPVPPPGLMVKLINSSGTKLTSGTLQYYEGSWKDATNNNDGTFTITTNAKTLSLRMTYEYGTQTKSNVTVGTDTVAFQTVNAQVKLQDSKGAAIDTGTVQYYAGAWRNLGTTTNGIASKELLPGTYSFRMTYAYANKDKQQDIGANPIVIFQTVNAAVQMQNSQGTLIDQGSVQYYSGAWRNFGVTTGGTATKELLPNTYSFRMTYAYASKDKQQDIGTNSTVVFQTVNANVQLQNSQGGLINQGTVQYYSGAWRDFGTTMNGVANKELLPNNYSFRMTYAFASKDKQQDLSSNPTVVFQTVNANVQLQNSQGGLINQGTVQYYSGAWRDFGTTTNGVANKELLPNNYSFRMTYAYASKDKQQDIGTIATVVFQTVNATVQLQNSQGILIDQGTVQYYSGAWRSFGTTTNGVAAKELLPNNYSFRMTHEYISMDKSQDISTNNTVSFSTVLCTVRVKNSQNQPVDNAQASYYSGAWRQIGSTVNGEVTKELLPANLTFRAKLGTVQQDKAQNLSTNNVVEFVL